MSHLPWYLLPIWPLVFWRIQRLRKWCRAAGGPGSELLWGLMWNGRVALIRVSEDLSGHRPCTFLAPVSDKRRLALMDTPSACPWRRPGSQTVLSGAASRDPGMRQEYGPEAIVPDTAPGIQPQKSPDPLPSAPQAGCRVQPKNGIRNMRLNRHQRRKRLLFGASSAPRGTRTSFIFGW